MGIYLNPENDEYKRAINSEIYVDKTELIAVTNRKLNTEHQNICVSRPRRFGKSMAANMLVAYYCKNVDSRDIFSGFKIANDETFEKHLNKYNVIHINMIITNGSFFSLYTVSRTSTRSFQSKQSTSEYSFLISHNNLLCR